MAGIVILAFRSRAFRFLDAGPSAARVPTIDGLRGFLALGVFCGHAFLYRHFLLTGIWGTWMPVAYEFGTHAGVALFFMITAFLFWTQMLGGRLRAGPFLVGRVFRIGPLYLAALAPVLACAWLATGGLDLKGTLPWLALGALHFAAGDINGYHGTRFILLGVTWTLAWEWRFYAALALVALIPRPLRLWVIAGAVACVSAYGSLGDPQGFSVVTAAPFFGAGMVAASLRRAGITWRARPSVRSGAAVFLILACAALDRTVYNVQGAVLLGAAFYLVATGADLFGLLTSRAALRFGEITYGVYLLQGLALALVFRNSVGLSAARDNAGMFWLMAGAALAVLIALAIAGHTCIERPGNRFGRWLARPRTARSVGPLRGRTAHGAD